MRWPSESIPPFQFGEGFTATDLMAEQASLFAVLRDENVAFPCNRPMTTNQMLRPAPCEVSYHGF